MVGGWVRGPGWGGGGRVEVDFHIKVTGVNVVPFRS